MRIVAQRVSGAAVTVDGQVRARVGGGLLVLLGIARGDDAAAAGRLAGKAARLRVFEDEQGRFDRSLLDTGGAALVVSQFTLIADSRRQKGTRPDFSEAAPREQAEPLYDVYIAVQIGQSKNRNGWAWGLLLGWIGVLCVALLPPNEPSTPAATPVVKEGWSGEDWKNYKREQRTRRDLPAADDARPGRAMTFTSPTCIAPTRRRSAAAVVGWPEPIPGQIVGRR